MIGLLLLAASVAWLWGSGWIAHKIGNLVGNTKGRAVTKVLIFVALLSLPFVDEVIGKYQFEALCKANGIESADISKARGKKVRAEYLERGIVSGTAMPIRADEVRFRDADSGEVLLQYQDYYAFGGWLMRYTPLSMGSQHPMLFSGNGCGLGSKRTIFQANQVLQIN